MLADTIRQVDRTFKARMDLLTGQPGEQTQGRRYGVLHMVTCIKHACVSVYFIAFLVLC